MVGDGICMNLTFGHAMVTKLNHIEYFGRGSQKDLPKSRYLSALIWSCVKIFLAFKSFQTTSSTRSRRPILQQVKTNHGKLPGSWSLRFHSHRNSQTTSHYGRTIYGSYFHFFSCFPMLGRSMCFGTRRGLKTRLK